MIGQRTGIHVVMISVAGLAWGGATCAPVTPPADPDDLLEGIEDEIAGAEPISTFDGEWLSDEHVYAVEITNRIGVVTLPNTDLLEVGDKMLVLVEVEGDQFTGRQYFTDGSIEEVLGRKLDENSILMVGGGFSWSLERISDPPPVTVEGDILEGIEDIINDSEPISTFDGEWLSGGSALALQITNRLGTATVSNSEAYDAGEVVLAIVTVEGDRFGGRQVLADGSIEEVIGWLLSETSLVITGGGTSTSLSRLDEINQAPAVSAGQNHSITLGVQDFVDLNGTVVDDDLPNDELTTTWSKLEGPDGLSFVDAGAVDTTVTFTEAGIYLLQLEASDGALTGSSVITITVHPAVVEEEELGG